MAAFNSSYDHLVGQDIAGHYRIISPLGEGGMGVAYRAWDEQRGVPVVIKIPRKIFFEDPKFAERFYREIQLLQGLFHPHIVPILAAGIHEGMPFIVMRFLPGGSLSNRRLRDSQGKPGPNPAATLHLWLPAIADALDYVHSQGVVHRDVKPANIFFDAFSGAYLGDFGIAKIVEESETFDKEHTLTATNLGVGTQQYMSPEQFTPKAVIDGRADQYALAVMVYEMLAGFPPFTGAKSHLIVEVMTQHAPPLRAIRGDLPESLVEAVHRALAKNPADRFMTCQEFAAAALRDVPSMADEPGVARLLCPKCENILKLSAEAAGRKGKCPKCRTAMKVAQDLGALWLLDEARRRKKVPDAGKRAELGPELESPNLDEQELEDFKPLSDIRLIARLSVMHRLNDFLRQLWSRVIRLLLQVLGWGPFQQSLCIGFAAHMTLVLWASSVPHKPLLQLQSPWLIITFTAPEAVEEFEEMQEEEFNAEEPDSAPEVSDAVVITREELAQPIAVVVSDPYPKEASYRQSDYSSEFGSGPDLINKISPGGAVLRPGGYGGRSEGERKKHVAKGGGSAASEAAVEAALKWIISHQMPDGGWSFDIAQCPSCQGKCSHSGAQMAKDRCGATSMAILPFLGRGYTHKEGPYKQQLEAGISFLATMAVQGKGKAYTGGNMYSQGLAGITLSESYAMTQDKRLAMPAQLALNFIMDAQDPVGGGWRYAPKQPGDTSVTGWQVMALKSGHMAYLQVNPLTIKKAVDFLNSVQTDDGSAYGYKDPGDGLGTSAAGLLCRMYLGWHKDHPSLERGVVRLAKAGPSKDLYFNYYATQIMHHMEGDIWQAWNTKIRDRLVDAQSRNGHEAGSWFDGFDEGYGPKYGGRLYCTAMATMILEVYYRHLPLYGSRINDGEFKE